MPGQRRSNGRERTCLRHTPRLEQINTDEIAKLLDGHAARRGSLLWTTWTSPTGGSVKHTMQGGRFFVSPGGQFRMSFDNRNPVSLESLVSNVFHVASHRFGAATSNAAPHEPEPSASLEPSTPLDRLARWIARRSVSHSEGFSALSAHRRGAPFPSKPASLLPPREKPTMSCQECDFVLYLFYPPSS